MKQFVSQITIRVCTAILYGLEFSLGGRRWQWCLLASLSLWVAFDAGKVFVESYLATGAFFTPAVIARVLHYLPSYFLASLLAAVVIYVPMMLLMHFLQRMIPKVDTQPVTAPAPTQFDFWPPPPSDPVTGMPLPSPHAEHSKADVSTGPNAK